jgi:hypothetical protein
MFFQIILPIIILLIILAEPVWKIVKTYIFAHHYDKVLDGASMVEDMVIEKSTSPSPFIRYLTFLAFIIGFFYLFIRFINLDFGDPGKVVGLLGGTVIWGILLYARYSR